MKKYRLPLWLPLVVLYMIGILGFWAPIYFPPIAALAKDGVNENWLGFTGAIIGALATLSAGGAALIAAYKTLVPMRSQLDQLIKQNDHNLYDRMRHRAAELNKEIILIEEVCGECASVDQALKAYLQGGLAPYMSQQAFKVAVDRFHQRVDTLRNAQGELWGTIKIQADRNAFINQSVMAAKLATQWVEIAEKQTQLAIVLINREISEWHPRRIAIADFGGRLHPKVAAEMRRAGFVISELEARLLN